jgi:hypothetical protein
MPPIPAGYAVASLQWTCQGDTEKMVCTLGLDVLSASSPTPTEVAALVSTAWLQAWTPAMLSSLYTFVGTSVTFGPQPGEGPSAEDVEASVGTLGVAPLTSNTALLVKKLTALGGRRNRGRMYLPGGYLGEVDVDQNGFVTAANTAILQARMVSFYNALVTPAPTLQPVILHQGERLNPGVRPAQFGPAPPPTPMTSFSVQRQVATQRRRMR